VSKKKDYSEDISMNMGFGDLFKGIGNLINLVNEMSEKGKSQITRTGEITGLDKNKGIRGVYGFTVRLGATGNTRVQPFGNIKKEENRITVQEIREPIVDIFEEEEGLLLIAELPGVARDDIDLDVKDDILIITASGKERKYAKEVLLPFKVDPNKVTTVLNHGVLEIRLSKTAD